MATIREIKRRMKAVQNIAQVTRALEAVSASKVKKAQAQVLASRPYSRKAWEVLEHIASQTTVGTGPPLHPLLDVRDEIRKRCLIVVTSDRGLAGAYNTNILRLAEQFIAEQNIPVSVIAVGRKGRDHLMRRGHNVIAEFSELPTPLTITYVAPIARTAIDDFASGKADEVLIAYTDFINTLTQRPVIEKLLPLRPTGGHEPPPPGGDGRAPNNGRKFEYIYEPSSAEILNTVVPRFVELQIYQAMLESLASEHSARMVAMRNASENAEELTKALRLVYNKARQLSITREILDIVGGAEALRRHEEITEQKAEAFE